MGVQAQERAVFHRCVDAGLICADNDEFLGTHGDAHLLLSPHGIHQVGHRQQQTAEVDALFVVVYRNIALQHVGLADKGGNEQVSGSLVQ